MSKGGGGSTPTSSTVTQSNLPDYAAPYFSQLMGQGLTQMATPYQQYQGQQVANTSPFQQAAQGAMANMQAVPQATNTAGQMDTNIANQAAGFNPQFDTSQLASSQINPMYAQSSQINPQQISGSQVAANQVGYQGYNPSANVQASNTSVQNWTDPGVASQYMSPYTSNVMAAQQALMGQQNQQQLNTINGQAVQAGAFGGDRQAIADAAQNQTYQLNLANMQSQALNSAYNQGQNTFLGSQGQSLQSQQANQQAGLQGQLANQQAQNTAGQYNAGQNLTAQGMNQQYGLQAQLANQQNALQTGLANQSTNLQGQSLNNQYGLQAQLANQGTNLQAQSLNNQYGLQAGSLNNQYGLQAQGLGAQYGIAGMQTGLSAANQLQSVGNQQQAQGLNWINGMNTMGATQQQQQQNLLNASQNNFSQAQNYNTTQLGNYGNLLHGIPVGQSYTQTNLQAAPSTTGMLGGLGALAVGGSQTGAATPSDRRLKKNVVELAMFENGLKVYAFTYNWEPDGVRHVGYMADEVLRVCPDAVSTRGGYLMVDYDRVGV